MGKIKFKCKGKLSDGSPCDQYVSAKMHKGIATFVRIQELTKEIKNLESINEDFSKQNQLLRALEEVPIVPKDFVFTLTCSHAHEYDYSYDEREQ